MQGFLRCFRDTIRVPRIRENYRVPRIRQNRDPRIGEIMSLPGITFSLKNPDIYIQWNSDNTTTHCKWRS